MLYANDLPANLEATDVNFYLFANYLGLNVHSSNLSETLCSLNDKKKVINDWCATNKLCLNNDRTMDLNPRLKAVII